MFVYTQGISHAVNHAHIYKSQLVQHIVCHTIAVRNITVNTVMLLAYTQYTRTHNIEKYYIK